MTGHRDHGLVVETVSRPKIIIIIFGLETGFGIALECVGILALIVRD